MTLENKSGGWWWQVLTHWGLVTHICVDTLTNIGSDSGLLPGRRQAIIWTNAGILLIGHLGTNFSEILIRIQTFSLKKIHLKMSVCEMASILSWPQYVKTLRSEQNGWCFAGNMCMDKYWHAQYYHSMDKYSYVQYNHSIDKYSYAQ